MPALAIPGEGLLIEPPEAAVKTRQLFGTRNPVTGGGAGSLISFTTTDKRTWVALNYRSQYEPVGGTSGALESHRVALDQVLGSYVWPGNGLTPLPGQLEHGWSVAATLHHLEKLEGLEEELDGAEAPSSLAQEVKALREQAEKRKDEYYARGIAELTRGVANDPSEVMIGVQVDRRIVAAKLSGFYVAERLVRVKEWNSYEDALKPAVSGRDGKIGQLPAQIGIYGVFLEASAQGKKQVAKTKRKNEEYNRGRHTGF